MILVNQIFWKALQASQDLIRRSTKLISQWIFELLFITWIGKNNIKSLYTVCSTPVNLKIYMKWNTFAVVPIPVKIARTLVSDVCKSPESEILISYYYLTLHNNMFLKWMHRLMQFR